MKPEFSKITISIPWQLMHWLLALPCHQQPWNRINLPLSSTCKDFNDLCHLCRNIIQNANICFVLPQNNSACKGLRMRALCYYDPVCGILTSICRPWWRSYTVYFNLTQTRRILGIILSEQIHIAPHRISRTFPSFCWRIAILFCFGVVSTMHHHWYGTGSVYDIYVIVTQQHYVIWKRMWSAIFKI